MSVAGPADRPKESVDERARRRGMTRRRVLGAAAVGGAGVAAARLFAADRLQALLPRSRTATGRTDWVSPLGAEPARVAQLLRRATFGATPEELQAAVGDGFAKTVDRLLETKPAPPPAFNGDEVTRGSRLNIPQLQLWWADHMLRTPTPFAERMTLFWHGHFTSDYRKVGAQTPFIYWQNLTWRDMGLGDLRSMLMRVTSDPAMLRYLDLATSTGRSPNENYARELLELFTLGAGNFTEDDVRSAAKALAGWVEPKPSSFAQVTVDAKNKVMQKYAVYESPESGFLDPKRAYTGAPISFLGKTGNFDAAKVIDAILARPATAAHVATRVIQQFVMPNPDRAYVNRIADRFRSSKYDVKTLLKAIFTSPEFMADRSYRSLVKSPTEFMIHALKAVAAPQLSRLVVGGGPGMGQVLFDPPDVGGWPNNDA